jgi:Fe-S cluster assembly protein SufD
VSTLLETPATEPALVTPDALDRVLARSRHLPPWWLDLKQQAWARAAALPLPKRTDELWRFSNVAGFQAGRPFAPAEAGAGGWKPAPFTFPCAGSLTFSNDRLGAETPLAAALKKQGVIFTTIEDAILHHRDLFKEHFLAQPSRFGSEKFRQLHAALTTGGTFLHVPAGVEVALPLVTTTLVSGEQSAIFPHTLIIAGDHAKVTLVEFRASADAHDHFAAGVNDVYAGPGAQVTCVAAQNWSPGSLSFQSNDIVVQRDAKVLSLSVHLGGRQNRHESHSQLRGPGSHSEMLALSVATGAQEFDQRTLQTHQAPHTSSNLLYKNTLAGRARTIFSGLIIVEPEAQKTDAYQSNRNLILSPDAEANALPGLEIMANDVRCTHGATSSKIADEHLFYFESRGIPPSVAKELLTFGFFEEVLGKLDNEALQDDLRALIKGKIVRREQEEGKEEGRS